METGDNIYLIFIFSLLFRFSIMIFSYTLSLPAL